MLFLMCNVMEINGNHLQGNKTLHQPSTATHAVASSHFRVDVCSRVVCMLMQGSTCMRPTCMRPNLGSTNAKISSLTKMCRRSCLLMQVNAFTSCIATKALNTLDSTLKGIMGIDYMHVQGSQGTTISQGGLTGSLAAGQQP